MIATIELPKELEVNALFKSAFRRITEVRLKIPRGVANHLYRASNNDRQELSIFASGKDRLIDAIIPPVTNGLQFIE